MSQPKYWRVESIEEWESRDKAARIPPSNAASTHGFGRDTGLPESADAGGVREPAHENFRSRHIEASGDLPTWSFKLYQKSHKEK